MNQTTQHILTGCFALVAAIMSTIVVLDTYLGNGEEEKAWTKDEVMECVVLYETAIENEQTREIQRGNIANRIFNRLLPP